MRSSLLVRKNWSSISGAIPAAFQYDDPMMGLLAPTYSSEIPKARCSMGLQQSAPTHGIRTECVEKRGKTGKIREAGDVVIDASWLQKTIYKKDNYDSTHYRGDPGKPPPRMMGEDDDV